MNYYYNMAGQCFYLPERVLEDPECFRAEEEEEEAEAEEVDEQC